MHIIVIVMELPAGSKLSTLDCPKVEFNKPTLGTPTYKAFELISLLVVESGDSTPNYRASELISLLAVESGDFTRNKLSLIYVHCIKFKLYVICFINLN